jgi:hypothetical protein
MLLVRNLRQKRRSVAFSSVIPQNLVVQIGLPGLGFRTRLDTGIYGAGSSHMHAGGKGARRYQSYAAEESSQLNNCYEDEEKSLELLRK